MFQNGIRNGRIYYLKTVNNNMIVKLVNSDRFYKHFFEHAAF